MENTERRKQTWSVEEKSKQKSQARIRTQEEIDKLPRHEVVEKRTSTSKLYSLGNNLYQAVMYSAPLHYKDEATGEWQDIDNTLVEERNSLGEVRLVNKHNGLMKVALGTGQKMVEITNENGETLSWTIEGARIKGGPAAKVARLEATDEGLHKKVQEKLVCEADFAEVMPGMRMRCQVGNASFKEDIIFETRTAAKPVAFLVKAPDLTLSLKEDGNVSVQNAKEEDAFTMPAPFMVDGRENVGKVTVELTKKTIDTWRLLYTPNEQWLESATFPVTLDPAVYTANRTEWGYVDSSTPTTAYPSGNTYPVMNQNDRRRLLYMRFGKTGATSLLPAIDASYAVTSAVLHMPSRIISGKAAPLHLREVLSNWDLSTLTYNNQPTVSAEDMDLATASTASRIDYQFNIAGLVQKWHTGENYGVVVDAREDGVDIQAYTTNEYPYIVITYAGQAGLEEYFTYESHSIGRAGAAHVNLFNGNLVFEHADTATNGSRMPVSLSHYYNSCYRDLNIFSAGFGWKHSMHKTMHVDGGYFIYTDGDGTRHNFMVAAKADPYRSTAYEDMSGLSLKMQAVGSTISTNTIYDKKDNYIKFVNLNNANVTGRDTQYCLISEAGDANGNKVTMSLASKVVGGILCPSIDSITDGVGRVTSLPVNAQGLLDKIKAPGYETTGLRFTYDANNRLAQITYEDDLFTTFAYDGLNLLTSITNHDGRKLTIEYEAYAPYRVKRVTESNGETVGNRREYSYSHLTTTVTDRTVPGGKQLFYAFNASGNLISTHDLLGHAVVANFTAEEPVNHPKSISKKMRAVVNLLRNHGFESSKHWLLAGPARFESQNQQMGERCLCFDSGLNGTTAQASQTLTITPMMPYVFSFYAKTCGKMALRAAVEYQDEQGVKQVIESPVLSDGPLYTYERLYFAFTLPHGSAHQVTIMLRGQGETGVPSRAWIDSAQLEEGVLPNRYSLLVNGDFSFDCAGRPLDWVPTADTTIDDTAYIPDDALGKPGGMTDHVLRIHGGTQKKAGYYQDVAVSGKTGDVFLVGGWAKGFSAADKENKKGFALRIAFQNEDGEYVDAEPVSWASQRKGWQFTCGASIAKESYKSLRVYIDYQNNINSAEFDGLFLHQEYFGQSFDYDDSGNVLSIQRLTGKKSEAEYDALDNLIKYRKPGHPKGEVYTMDYGPTDADKKKHLLKKSTSPSGTTEQHTYDTRGNRLTTVVTGPNTSDFIKSGMTYASNENYPSVLTDARGKSVTQDIDATLGVLKSVTDPRGQAVANTYDLLRRLTATTTTADGKTYKNTYTYTDGKLTQVAHNTGSDADCDVAYHFAYDALGNPTTARVGSQLLSERVYTETGDKLMKRLEYGNGGKVYYERDAYKRLTSVRFDEETEPRYVYDYDASGNVGRLTDNHLGETTSYESDFASRPGRAQTMAGNRHVYTQEVAYDGASRVAKTRELVGENKTPYVTEYAYDSEDRPVEITYGVPEKGVKYAYDSLGRLMMRKLLDDAGGYLTNYEYAQGGQGAGSTTALVQSIVQDGHSFAYIYDEVGNIVCENRNGLETTYEYDRLGQLTRVNDPHEGRTTIYEYDRGGNILVKKVYAYTRGALPGTAQNEVAYAYGDTNWKDKLTAYDGTAITYDAIGNPLNDGTWAYTWKVGRQLEEMGKAGETVQFRYNANGLRVRKESTSRGVTKYILRGKQIAHLTRTLEGAPVAEMHFWYDAQGKAAMVSYNGKEYLYVYNVQGDVVALLDKGNGCAEVVEYHYDAWGRQVSCTGSMAATLGVEQPFRYRGYVYDEETGLYYLRSRYYNPVWGRFVNADSVLTRNLYEYCRSNPVMKRDLLGTYDEDVPTNTFNLDASIKSQKQKKEYDAKYSSKNTLISDSPGQSFGYNNVPGSDVVMIAAQEMVPPADSGLSYFKYGQRIIDRIIDNPTDRFHNFPLLVDVMTSPEDFQLLIGGDGKEYIMIELPGEIAIASSNGETNVYSGSFEWIINSGGEIRHRFFSPRNTGVFGGGGSTKGGGSGRSF